MSGYVELRGVYAYSFVWYQLTLSSSLPNYSGMELKLYGTLSDVLSSNPDKVHIYIPEGYDMTLPINNLSLRFLVTSGYEDGCYKFVNGDTFHLFFSCVVTFPV